jgi:hypothetical protein
MKSSTFVTLCALRLPLQQPPALLEEPCLPLMESVTETIHLPWSGHGYMVQVMILLRSSTRLHLVLLISYVLSGVKRILLVMFLEEQIYMRNHTESTLSPLISLQLCNYRTVLQITMDRLELRAQLLAPLEEGQIPCGWSRINMFTYLEATLAGSPAVLPVKRF